jgi:serine/threonine-protein kinase RsbW
VSNKRRRLVELTFPSILGYEKIAMATVAAFARRHGVGGERIDDLCTAVSEACLNAIEYGNRAEADIPVTLILSVDGQRLIVEVRDQALGPTKPRVGRPLVDLTHPPQGVHGNMGLFLIHSLMDEVDIICRPDVTQVQMMLRLPPAMRAS